VAAKQRLRWAFYDTGRIELPDAERTYRYGRRLGDAVVDGQAVAGQLIDEGWAVPYVP
jgi:endonuclease YncB( thermonuclease family)